MTFNIDYQSEGFKAGAPIANGAGILTTSWDELLWAAITVGRPNRHYIFRHGKASTYEALFRLSLVRMALEQHGPRGRRLFRTSAASTLDPSEKGAVNYFLGLTICKLFAAKLLDAPWMLHLDVFRPLLNPVLKGRSRPDLVGETATGEWVAMECKGRASEPNADAKEKAKVQAQRLISVNGKAPDYSAGGVAYFKSDVLRFFWRDPEPDLKTRNPIMANLDSTSWRHYYEPVLGLLRADAVSFQRMQQEQVLLPVEGVDISIGIHPKVLQALARSQWDHARKIANEVRLQPSELKYQADGVVVKAGESWVKPYSDQDELDE